MVVGEEVGKWDEGFVVKGAIIGGEGDKRQFLVMRSLVPSKKVNLVSNSFEN